MEHELSLRHSQEPVTGIVPDESNLHLIRVMALNSFLILYTHPRRSLPNSLLITHFRTSFFFFFYSGSSHMKHRASVKRFVSLQFLNLRQSVGLLGRGISPSQGHFLTQARNKYRQPSMPQVGLEPTIAVFERAKTYFPTKISFY
jgi:hypothetical protein